MPRPRLLENRNAPKGYDRYALKPTQVNTAQPTTAARHAHTGTETAATTIETPNNGPHKLQTAIAADNAAARSA